jgi:hypothetical protein
VFAGLEIRVENYVEATFWLFGRLSFEREDIDKVNLPDFEICIFVNKDEI